MMATRTLDSPPSILPLYARAAAPLIPGASLLPFVPGGGKEVPELELELAGVTPDPDRVAAYAKVCGFTLRDELPPTYPHVLAHPLHMELLARAPFSAVGVVHIANRIVLHRPLLLGEPLTISAGVQGFAPHRRGRTSDFVSEARFGDGLVWEGFSTTLKRGGGDASLPREEGLEDPPVTAHWRLPEDLGRRYAAVSGDHNPIHLHALPAKAF